MAQLSWLILPNDLKLHYAIRYDATAKEFRRNDREGKKLWGGALTGQIIQALAVSRSAPQDQNRDCIYAGLSPPR
jgi:hypothetical protein